MDTAKIAVRGSTQEHLEVADILDDLVIMKDGSVALVVRVSAVNFGLLSEKEQEAIIYAYAGMINSLNFSIQILIRSQKKDISHYVALLEAEEKKQTNALLKNQIVSYRQFVLDTVKENNVLDKKFYIVIPFSSLELGAAMTTRGLLGRNKKGLPLPAKTIVERAGVALMPKRDHLLRQLGRLGLRAKQLTTAELIEVFYEIYNAGREMKKETGAAAQKFEQI
ncbi:hypothetical protein HY440_02285 [Candidatus Microgenomates bacterium]|nr:hypothetical protein [Candidatus Microgenomates bacterium]